MAPCKRSKSDGAVFECKTCHKKFTSFQALGGHRTSHKRMMRVGSEGMILRTEKIKNVHGCSVCGLEFSMGQALGGHMTKHRRQECKDRKDEKKAAAAAAVQFDLNMPPVQFNQFFWDVPMIQFF